MEDETKTINIKVNENNEITAYAIIGGVSGIDISITALPDSFIENFDSKYYLYVDGNIKVNPDYVAPEIHL
ncbi:DUF2977 domain-containing protein [Staphylococcus equorum]|uniref:DUF2977 domain-containing protein n=1 Tax=Staphylococcus equorum TaxID=246432 RepID=UPI0025520EBC|nr:DUF2977 domain-containing protein [Staphylococcus equorum]MDK9857641.1 DUF2977 domain-containing protein [Staphylococcus equorum]MDK9874702.1 DUF2977 domain-containing protein [Staphylococcus equorum]